MKIQSLNLRTPLLASLQTLVADSEDIFLSFAREYPTLLRETESNLRSTHRIVEEFEGKKGASAGREGRSLAETVSLTQSIVRETIESLETMGQSDIELFDELESNIAGLAGLTERIAHIKADSTEMEIISLNAMTVALKAGSSGKAFSIITDELKRLSASIIALTDEVNANGDLITTRFADLKQLMTKITIDLQLTQQQVNVELSSRIREYLRGFDTVVSLLNGLITRAEGVKPPLSKVMEETQKQDIIRQSVDHVIISIEELREIPENADTETLLDELAFYSMMPKLCTAVLEEIEQIIRGSKESIDAQIRVARAAIGGLDAERNGIAAEYLDENGSGELNMPGLFRATGESLRKLKQSLRELSSMKRGLSSLALGLLKDIQTLHASFAQFSRLIVRFQTIDIASRIEVAKNEVLSQMVSTVAEMSELTQRIRADVEASFNLTSGFLGTSKQMIHQINEQFEAEDSLVRKQENKLDIKLDQLEENEQEIDSMIRNFSIFSGVFFELFAESTSNFDRLDGLLERIAESKRLLAAIQAEAREAQEQTMARHELDTWELKNTKLQDIIARFTIFSHKQAAGRLAGFDVEDGVESGEVTLF